MITRRALDVLALWRLSIAVALTTSNRRRTVRCSLSRDLELPVKRGSWRIPLEVSLLLDEVPDRSGCFSKGEARASRRRTKSVLRSGGPPLRSIPGSSPRSPYNAGRIKRELPLCEKLSSTESRDDPYPTARTRKEDIPGLISAHFRKPGDPVAATFAGHFSEAMHCLPWSLNGLATSDT